MTNDKATTQHTLGTNPIGRLLLQYSVPAIIAAVATSLYNIVDSIFIGRGVGAMAISGLAVTFPLMNLVVGFCTLVAAGGATISSIFLGQKNLNRAKDTINNVLFLCIVHSIIFGGLSLLFLDEILYFFGATDETIPYAREFMKIILYGTPFSYIFIGLNNLMRATGYPKKAMISALLSVVVNIVFAPIFIFVFEWGIKGAALATILGQLVAFVWVIIHFMSKNSIVYFDRHRKWVSWSLVKHIYAIGMSPLLMNATACFVVVFINKSLLNVAGDLGNIAIGSYGIMNRTTMFFVMIVFGVTQGMQPILGYNYGASQWNRVAETLRKGIWIGVSITTIGWIATELFPDAISSLFTTDETMITIARDGFRIFFIAYPVIGAQIVIQNYFQSIGHPKLSIFLSLTRQLIFLVPLLWLLPRYLGINGVWASMAVSDILAFILAVVTLFVINRRFQREISEATTK